MMNRIPGASRVRSMNKKIIDQLSNKLVVSRGYDIHNNHYLFSDPRGGSTWLMEIIQTITKEPVVWEPLKLNRNNNPFKNINFGWRQHIPEDAEWTEAKALFDKLFKGKVLVYSILYRSTVSQVLNSKSLLFKFCRGNALLPWLTNHYSFNHKPILLIRHPFAVAGSQLRHGGWNKPFTNFNIPDSPYNDNYTKHEKFLKTIKTKEEALVAEWCLANSEPLYHADNNIKWLTINYEEFVLNPEKTLSRILTSWGMDYDLSLINFKKNSSTTKGDSPDAIIDRLSNWQKQFNKDQIENMGRVLEYFEMDVYSKNNPLPEKVFNYGS